MTNKISEFVDVINIQGCNILLEQRLTLLKEIEQKVRYSNDDELLEDFKELINWLTVIDASSFKKSIELKKRYQAKLAKQKKTKSAIASYQKFL